MRKRPLRFGLAGVVVGAALLGFALRAGGSPSALVTAHSNFDLARAHNFRDFDLFSLGPRYGDQPLTAVLRRNSRGAGPIRTNFVSFLYGRCDAVREACTPPLEVQVWPACVRNPSSYQLLPSESRRIEHLRLRGVPALYYGSLGTPRLEVSTGNATVVLFGRTRAQVLAAARKLHPVNRFSRTNLPAPVRGSLTGSIGC